MNHDATMTYTSSESCELVLLSWLASDLPSIGDYMINSRWEAIFLFSNLRGLL